MGFYIVDIIKAWETARHRLRLRLQVYTQAEKATSHQNRFPTKTDAINSDQDSKGQVVHHPSALWLSVPRQHTCIELMQILEILQSWKDDPPLKSKQVISRPL